MTKLCIGTLLIYHLQPEYAIVWYAKFSGIWGYDTGRDNQNLHKIISGVERIEKELEMISIHHED